MLNSKNPASNNVKMRIEERKFDVYRNLGKQETKESYFFKLDDEGNLVKLGDGTYGVVYEVMRIGTNEDEQTERFAIKLLYASKASNDPSSSGLINNAEDRFKQEIHASKQIINKVGAQNFRNVIKIFAGTNKFQPNGSLLKAFEKSGYKVSNYALVMKYYQYTLKDLLEKRVLKQYQISLPDVVKNKIRNQENSPSTDGKSNESFASDTTPLIQELEKISREIYSDEDKLETDIRKVVNDHDKFKSSSEDVVNDIRIQPMTGYELLKQLGFEERIKITLALIIEIAYGIQIIHKADMFHRDIKPANIFLNVTDEGVIRDVSVGDLGFVKPQEAISENTIVQGEFDIHQAIAFGTHHFRSPEQKDYMDVCDVEFEKGENGESNYTVLVKDPKFRDTIIETGDFAIFSKDEKKHRFTIKKIANGHDEDDYIRKITFEYEQSNHLQTLCEDDQSAHMVLYKNQTERTDLFGLGALIYDLVTAGESPERFYEKIKSFDKEGNSYQDLFKHYQQLVYSGLQDQSFSAIFRPFKQPGAKYASPKIVKIILRCMLYMVKDNYYNDTIKTFKEARKSKENNYNYMAVKEAKNDLEKLKQEINAFDLTSKSTFFGVPANLADRNSHQNFVETIQDIQQVPFLQRLPKAFFYFRKLFQQIEDEKAYFIQLLPEGITYIKNEEDFSFENEERYKNNEAYIQDIRDNASPKILRSVSHLFIPDYLNFIQRQIEISQIESDSDSKYKFTFQDSAWVGNKIEEGDFLFVNNSTNLLKINSVNKEEKIISLVLQQSGDDEIKSSLLPNGSVKATYIQKLNSDKYYSQILGIYLYQLFLVGINGTSKSTLPLIYSLAGYFQITQNLQIVQLKDLPLQRESPAFGIISKLLRMYLKLTLTDYEFSYIQSSNISLLKQVRVDLGKLAEEIRKIFPDFFYETKPSNDIKLKPDVPLLDTKANIGELLGREISLNLDDETRGLLGLGKPMYALSLRQKGNGTVIKKPNQFTYSAGDEVSLTVENSPGWQFSHWRIIEGNDEQEQRESVCKITIQQHIEVEAIFKQTCNLIVNIKPENSGNYEVIPKKETYLVGDQICLLAQPNNDHRFDKWGVNNRVVSSRLSTKKEELEFVLKNTELRITAYFQTKKHSFFR